MSFVFVPLVPTNFRTWLPNGEPADVEIVAREEQVGVHDVVWKDHVTPAGRSADEKVTVSEVPDTKVAVTVVCTELPGEVLADPGLADMLKSNGCGAERVRVYVVVLETVLLDPVIVIGKVPRGDVALVETVNVELNGGVPEAGANVHDVSVGHPVWLRVTGSEDVPVTETIALVVWPRSTVAEDGVTEADH